MSTEVLRRRGTASENASFIGGEGEFTVDLTNGTINVHNGNGTPGGIPLARADLQNVLLASLLNKGLAAKNMSNVLLSDVLSLGVAAKDLSNITLSQFSSKGLAYKTLANVNLSALGNFAGTDDTNTHAGGVAYKDLSNTSLSSFSNFLGTDDTASHAGGLMLKDGSNATVGSSTAFASKSLNNTVLSNYGNFTGTDDTVSHAGGLAYKDMSNVDLGSLGFAEDDLSNVVFTSSLINTIAAAGLAKSDLSNTDISTIIETEVQSYAANKTLSNVTQISNSSIVADKNLSNVDPLLYSKSFRNVILNNRTLINTTGYTSGTAVNKDLEIVNKWNSGANGSSMVLQNELCFKGTVYQNLDNLSLLNNQFTIWLTEVKEVTTNNDTSVTVSIRDQSENVIYSKTLSANDNEFEVDFEEESLEDIDPSLYDNIENGTVQLRLYLVSANSDYIFIKNLQMELGNATTPEIRPYEFEYAACALDSVYAKKSDMTKVYKPAGSVAYNSLPSLTASVLGNVYDVTDSFTTDNRFVEGTGKSYPAGTNVVVVDTGTSSNPVYKFDVLPGMVDLSGYVPTSRTINGQALTNNVTLTANDIGALPNTAIIPAPIYVSGVTVNIASGSTSATIDVSSYINSGRKYIPTVLLSSSSASNLLGYCEFSGNNVTVYSNSQTVSDSAGVIILMPVVTTDNTVRGITNGRGEVMTAVGDINTTLHNLNSGSN